MRTRRICVGLATALASILAACGGDSASDDTAVSSASTTPTESLDASLASGGTASDVTTAGVDGTAASSPAGDSTEPGAPTDDRAIDPDGWIKYGYPTGLAQWDPIRSTISQDNVYLYAAYDRLVHQSPAGELVPGLATEWSVSDDGLTWTFMLREGVTFQDGTAFDADAVKANVERAQTTEGSTSAPELTPIVGIEVVSPTEIQFTLSTATPQLPAIFSDRAGMMASPAAFDGLARNPVGAGMFRLVDETEGVEVTLERYEGYWNPDDVKAAKLTITAIPDAITRLNALKSGQLNWSVVSSSDYDTMTSDANFETALFDSISYQTITIFKPHSPLDDPKVRQAMIAALDREQINATLNQGHGIPCDQPFPPGYYAFDEELGCDTNPYDPERAKELLAEAGYPDGFEISMQITNGTEVTQQAEVIQAQLAQVGIKLTITTVEVSRFVPGFYVEGMYDTALGTWGGRASPLQTLQILYASTGLLNPGKLPVPEFDEALASAVAATSEETQLAAVNDATAIAVEQVYDIPLWFIPFPNVWTTDLVGVQGYLLGKQEFRGVGVAE